jgi:hypothetical protein
LKVCGCLAKWNIKGAKPRKHLRENTQIALSHLPHLTKLPASQAYGFLVGGDDLGQQNQRAFVLQ